MSTTAPKRIKYGDQIITAVESPDDIALGDFLFFDVEMADAGLPYTFDDVRAASEYDPTSGEQAPRGGQMLVGIALLWISFRRAKVPVHMRDLLEWCDGKEYTYLDSPQDRQGPTKAGKKGGAKKAPASLPASGQPVELDAPSGEPPTTDTAA